MQIRKSIVEVLSTPGHLISVAARSFARLSEVRLKPLGFGLGNIPVLVALEGNAAMSQRDLAYFARIEQPSMAQMLTRMRRDGLIDRQPDPSDGRSAQISLTDSARSRLPHACETLFQGNDEALRGFTEEEASQLVALLSRLIANLDEMNGACEGPKSRSSPIEREL